MAASISVFLVDDVSELRDLVRWGLEEDSRFEVVGEAGDGKSAIEGIEQTDPSVILLDLAMPDMDGLELIDTVRERNRDVAIVVLSGFAAERLKPVALKGGADSFVEKGAPMDELREVTRKAVASRRGSNGRTRVSNGH